MAEIFIELGIVIMAAALAAILLNFFKQPMILAYIFAGLIIGPAMLGLINDTNTITVLSEIGIAFLLFIVGLEIDFRRLKDIGKTALAIGIGQCVFTWLFGFYIATLLGFSGVESFYIGVILAFSSTMITVKLYSDKNELDTLHGRIVIGVLLVQDVIAIFVLALLPALSHPTAVLLIDAAGKGFILFLLAFIASRFVMPLIFRFVASSQELLLLTSVAGCFGFAVIAAELGYSFAIGAFLAGVTIASTPFNVDVIAKVRSLRDFFAIIFFVALGMQLLSQGSASSILSIAALTIIFSLFVLIGNPLIVLFIMALLGHKPRPSFLTGVAIAQISEFSLIVAAMGLSLNHLRPEIITITTGVAAVTITLSTYMIKYDEQLYKIFSKTLKPLELFSKKEDLEYAVEKKGYDVIMCGYNRIGYDIFNKLRQLHKSIIVVDYNPELITRLKSEKIACLYGDVGDIEILDRLDFAKAKLLIATVPGLSESKLLINHAKAANKDIIVIVTADQVNSALKLYAAGADYVIMPHYLGGEHAALLLEQFSTNVSKVVETKINHIKQLHSRKNIY